jgi:hypothetical protein
MEKFNDLCFFKQQHGHCHVPHTYEANPSLAQWVKRQRYQFKLKMEGKRSTLTDDRIGMLERMQFVWSSHEAVWAERLVELCNYKRIHKNCLVPSSYKQNQQLAIWVKRQRRQYKFYKEGQPTSMTAERIEQLNRIGFEWDCRKPKTSNSSNVSSEDQETKPNQGDDQQVRSPPAIIPSDSPSFADDRGPDEEEVARIMVNAGRQPSNEKPAPVPQQHPHLLSGLLNQQNLFNNPDHLEVMRQRLLLQLQESVLAGANRNDTAMPPTSSSVQQQQPSSMAALLLGQSSTHPSPLQEYLLKNKR